MPSTKSHSLLQTISKSLCGLVLTGGALFANATLADEHHQHAASYELVELKDNLYWLSGGKGGNILLSQGEDGMLLIDNDYQDMSQALEKVLEQFGGLAEVDFVINTHWHGDHTQNNTMLGESSTIVAHRNVRERLSTPQEVPFFGMKSEPYAKAGLPDITFKQQTTLHFNEHTIELIHFPLSHTDSDSVTFFEEANVVHMGDLFFNGFFPFIDVDNGGNVVNMANSIDAILDIVDNDTVIVPGHGPIANKADLAAFNQMLKGTTKEVKANKDKGMTLEQAQAAGLSDNWVEWTDGFIPVPAWIGIVYRSL